VGSESFVITWSVKFAMWEFASSS